jgi:hypothetical protein
VRIAKGRERTNSVGVEVGECITADIVGLAVGLLWDDTLPEHVRLALSGLVSGELPIDLIPNVGHGDEGSYNTIPLASLDC